MVVAEERIRPGSRWVLRSGVHSGTVIEVQGHTFAGSIKYRNVEKGDNTGSAWEDDEGRVHTRRRDEFLTLYRPEERQNGHGETQPAFRQRNVPKKVEPSPLPGPPPADGPNASFMTITPMLAQEWLDRGGANRHRNDKRVGQLAAAIRRGDWRLTGDTIKLDADGLIRDGQHRLAAIVEAGVDVQSLVVFGVEDDAFDVMDTGRPRSIPDILGLRGYKYVNGLASASRNLILWEATGRLVATTVASRELVTSATVLRYVEAHPEVQANMPVGDAIRMVVTGGIGVWVALVTLFARVDADKSNDFTYRLLNGEGLERGNPILVLRNRLISREFYTQNADDKEQLAAAVINAWNAYRRGDRIEHWNALVWRSVGSRAQPFPRPDDERLL